MPLSLASQIKNQVYKAIDFLMQFLSIIQNNGLLNLYNAIMRFNYIHILIQ